jgi:NAD(P)-dependent dehydrogenase (short-subunit alcohol dehydrogenase family)
VKLALVTGGGNGLGEAIARRIAQDAKRVVVLDRDAEAAARVASSLPGSTSLGGDVTDADAMAAAFDSIGDVPDVVVCNAGIVRFGPLLSLPLEHWRAVLEVNLTGTFIVAREAANRMVGAGVGGSITAITSMNGVAPGPNAGSYGSSKAALIRLAQQMALEWGPHGIRVNTVAPGMIDGGMSTEIFADPKFREIRTSKVPLGRLGTAEDIAEAVHWLSSAGASYVTGQTILVDGGVTMSAIANLPRPPSVDGVGSRD